MHIVDSVGWLAYFKGDVLAQSFRPYLRNLAELICPTIIIYEVTKRLELDVSRQAAAQAAAQLLKTRVITLDDALATAAARISITHRLPMADAIIYTTAVVYRATVITSDAHLRNLPGVHFIAHPASMN